MPLWLGNNSDRQAQVRAIVTGQDPSQSCLQKCVEPYCSNVIHSMQQHRNNWSKHYPYDTPRSTEMIYIYIYILVTYKYAYTIRCIDLKSIQYRSKNMRRYKYLYEYDKYMYLQNIHKCIDFKKYMIHMCAYMFTGIYMHLRTYLKYINPKKILHMCAYCTHKQTNQQTHTHTHTHIHTYTHTYMHTYT